MNDKGENYRERGCVFISSSSVQSLYTICRNVRRLNLHKLLVQSAYKETDKDLWF